MLPPTSNPYLELTAEFNRGRLRALLSSGQAVVFHRLAIMSKDGDWIVREDDEALRHILEVLAAKQSRYRFGAPLDRRWLQGGWSAHLEHREGGLRLRTDFVSRPPRIDARQLAAMWSKADASGVPVIDLEPLAALKLTNREKDYAVVGELARRMTDPRQQLRFSRSARDLIDLAARHADLVQELLGTRPALAAIAAGRDALEEAIDRERRQLMRSNEVRLDRYRAAAEAWARQWPAVEARMRELPLTEAHAMMTRFAAACLPFAPAGGEHA